MRLTMKEKKKLTKIVSERYQRASKKQKGVILDEFVALTGYNHCYASYLLRNHGRKVRVNCNTVMVADVNRRPRGQRRRIYDQKVFIVLKRIWEIMDFICGKRLAPVMGELLPVLRKYREVKVDAPTARKLLKVSASTIDRLLRQEKKKYTLKSRSKTKPGTLLKNQIPIRTFSEWDEGRPGFMEIDLVGHDGGDARGEFIQTLDVTDVCTGWTETRAVRNKAQVWVFEALKEIMDRIPFDLLGIDSDNGSEFINHHLFRFCTERKITFTRTRSYRKNDNCFVEQKNYSVVRRFAGYLRYNTEEELKLLNELYSYLRLYTNFFQPVMKLTEKTRIGSRVIKRYDTPRSPYKRVLESPHVSEESKEKLRKQYDRLNPAGLKRQITKIQNKLLRLGSLKERLRKQALNENKSKTMSLGGYLDVGWSEKINSGAFGEANFSGLSPDSVLFDNIDLNDDKKAELVGVDFT